MRGAISVSTDRDTYSHGAALSSGVHQVPHGRAALLAPPTAIHTSAIVRSSGGSRGAARHPDTDRAAASWPHGRGLATASRGLHLGDGIPNGRRRKPDSTVCQRTPRHLPRL